MKKQETWANHFQITFEKDLQNGCGLALSALRSTLVPVEEWGDFAAVNVERF